MMGEKITLGDARLTLYRDAPSWGEMTRTMAVGQFSCATAEGGADLLEQVAQQARKDGAEALIGPMDGDTWHSYRLITETDGSKPFLMEPSSKPHDIAAFKQAGFETVGSYFSASAPLAGIPTNAPRETGEFQIETWDGTAPEALFTQVHALSCEAFAKNPFYKPIDLKAFLAMYMPVVPLLKQQLILFARAKDSALVGFLFGIPNYAEGAQPSAVILKTYASLRKGAGHALSAQFYRASKELGYQTALHALMHDDNLSAIRSGLNGAEVFRRYALMGRRLDR